MTLPELPPLHHLFLNEKDKFGAEVYGQACYAKGVEKGRAELLKEIGEPVAWLITHGEDCFATNEPGYAADFSDNEREPLYQLPKEAE